MIKQNNFLMMDLKGYTLSDEERKLLSHKYTAGVVFFSRNFKNTDQLRALVKEIRQVRPDILIGIDHEGGRVQRFASKEITLLPPVSLWGKVFEKDPGLAKKMVFECGWITGFELGCLDIDITFSPVLDIDRNISSVLKTRCFSKLASVISQLAICYLNGVLETGVKIVGKHFPGHGGVSADSHLSLPIDKRGMDLLQEDIYPFNEVIKSGITGIMPSHIIYSECSKEPATFSDYWIQQVLRQKLCFKGAVFSDCLNMSAASYAGTMPNRTAKALKAGCDVVLICNNRIAVKEVLNSFFNDEFSISKHNRLQGMRRQHKSLCDAKLRVDTFKAKLAKIIRT